MLQETLKLIFFNSLRGPATLNRLIFQTCLKWNCSYVCRNFCENFKQKNEEVIAYTSWVVRRDRVQSLSQPDRKQGREGGGEMVQCIDFSFEKPSLMLLLRSVCHVICKGDGYAWTADLSNTPDLMEVRCEICTPPPASELALPNDNPKLDCARGKFKLLPEYITERDVWWLIVKRKSHAIPWHWGFFFVIYCLNFFKSI